MNNVQKMIIAFLLIFVAGCVSFFSQINAQSLMEDTKFKYAVAVVLKHEGGLSNNLQDPGLITKYGISLRYLIHADIDVNADKKINKEDVLGLTIEQARSIYYTQWWKKFRYYKINNALTAAKIFDFSVNAGPEQSTKIIQRALIALGNKNVKVDGNLTDEVFDLINSSDQMQLHSQLSHFEEQFYLLIISNNSSLKIFKKGWLKRANS